MVIRIENLPSALQLNVNHTHYFIVFFISVNFRCDKLHLLIGWVSNWPSAERRENWIEQN